MNETLIAIALTKLLKRCNGKLQQNFYTIPEVKAGYIVLAKLTKYSGDWEDLDLTKVIFQLERKK